MIYATLDADVIRQTLCERIRTHGDPPCFLESIVSYLLIVQACGNAIQSRLSQPSDALTWIAAMVWTMRYSQYLVSLG